jgi:tetratricopeptide (TPR) repeat protein
MAASAQDGSDRTLFQTHFDRGRALHDGKRYAEAEGELEEAYFLRPRDANVLNLLGIVYFRQQKFDKAEEVYRKLLVQNPEEPTLSYNLGVIYLKLDRLEEAESALVKALELSGSNPRISFYLGTVYEKLRRFQDAIFHYRHAGASSSIRRIEDRLAAARPAAPERPSRKGTDTAEFKAQELREALSHPPPDLAVPAKAVRAVSPALLAERREGETRPVVRVAPPPPPPATPPPRLEEQARTLPAAGPPAQAERAAQETFRFLEPHVLQVDFSGKIFIKLGTIYSYSGDLTFWVKERRPGTTPALVIITGRGRLILTDGEREVTLLHVDDEAIYVEPSHLLACEETLTPRYVRIDAAGPLEFVQLEGRGIVALSVGSKPLPLTITPDLPVSVPAASVIMWSGAINAVPVADRQIYEVIRRSGGGESSPLIRLEGRGRILMEQARPA